MSAQGCLPRGVSDWVGVCPGGHVCPGGGVPGPVGGRGNLVRYCPLPVDRMTHASENITLPHTSFAGGKNLAHACSIEMNGYFLLCDHQPLFHQLRFTLLIIIQFMILYLILCSNVPLKIEIVLLFTLCSVEKYCILIISIDNLTF